MCKRKQSKSRLGWEGKDGRMGFRKKKEDDFGGDDAEWVKSQRGGRLLRQGVFQARQTVSPPVDGSVPLQA